MAILRVKQEKIKYTDVSKIPSDYTEKMNKEYNWMAKGYDTFMTIFPLWKRWIKKTIPHIVGEKILEVSFGSGYLMTQYATDKKEIYGIDYNEKMLKITSTKMKRLNIRAHLSQGNGEKAMSELNRVLKKEGSLLLVDFDYPQNRNIFGYLIVRLWEKFGDIIKDISSLLVQHDFDYEDIPVGGFGSVHMFIAKK